MAKCKFVWDKQSSVAGTTLYAKEGCMRDTGVYVPKIEQLGARIDVVLWLHGWYVQNSQNLLQPAKGYETGLREGLLASKTNVVLVAPWLGLQTHSGQGTLRIGDLGEGKGCQLYLEQVMEALTNWYVDTFIAGEAYQIGGRPPNYQIGNLVIACHSGGGDLMRAVTGALGDLKSALKECWGFDCLYAFGKTYAHWALPLSAAGVKTYFYLANGSSRVHFAEFWKAVFGTPKDPSPGKPQNIFLAPAVPGVEVDRTAFQSVEDIKGKPDTGNPYETVRRKVDPFLDDPDQYSTKLRQEALKDHFQVVRELFGHRLSESGLG
jgi:hypothetical protein